MKLKNLVKNAKLATATGLASLAMTFNPLCSSAQSPLKLQETEPSRQGEFYFLGGQGTASREGGNTQFYLETGLREQITKSISLGGAYINEGHPEKVGHRDGFALTAGYGVSIGKLRLEARGGPYFNMNTVSSLDNPNEELNEKGLGAVLSLGAKYPIGNSGVNAIVQINEILMPGSDSFNTFGVMGGLGYDWGGNSLDKSSAKKLSTEQDNKYSLSLMGGPSTTTRAGAKTGAGLELELQRELSERFGWNLIIKSEADSELSERKGVASQFLFKTPKLGRLRLGMGIGPYVAQESNVDDEGIKILGDASIFAELDITDNWAVRLKGNRIFSTYDKDGDEVLVGAVRKF